MGVTSGPFKQQMLKSLIDSDYKKPKENERVFQDEHPFRKTTFIQAMKRHEDKLRKADLERHQMKEDLHRRVEREQHDTIVANEIKQKK